MAKANRKSAKVFITVQESSLRRRGLPNPWKLVSRFCTKLYYQYEYCIAIIGKLSLSSQFNYQTTFSIKGYS